MIEFFKLKSLNKKQRIRKVVKILELAENSIVNDVKDELLDSFYLKQLFNVVIDDLDIKLREKILSLTAKDIDENKREILNLVRHSLYSVTGYSPSEWDLIMPHTHGKDAEEIKNLKRKSFKHTYVYAEDIRTPFNIGSIFRTAESFGVEKLFLSENCVSPLNKKARRVAMGTVDYLLWEYVSFEKLPAVPIIALETGGTDIASFKFPKEGVVIVGNEELGISSEILKKADAVVSIPIYGIKASINVSVAFGILMQKWTEDILKEEIVKEN